MGYKHRLDVSSMSVGIRDSRPHPAMSKWHPSWTERKTLWRVWRPSILQIDISTKGDMDISVTRGRALRMNTPYSIGVLNNRRWNITQRTRRQWRQHFIQEKEVGSGYISCYFRNACRLWWEEPVAIWMPRRKEFVSSWNQYPISMLEVCSTKLVDHPSPWVSGKPPTRWKGVSTGSYSMSYTHHHQIQFILVWVDSASWKSGMGESIGLLSALVPVLCSRWWRDVVKQYRVLEYNTPVLRIHCVADIELARAHCTVQ